MSPFTTAPNTIEQADFLGGYAPVPEIVNEEPNTLLDVMNLLPEGGRSGSLESRKGFTRLLAYLMASYQILNIFPFRGNGNHYLICVLTDGTTDANNVQIWAVNLAAATAARIDTSGRVWAGSTKNHWGIGVSEVYYGGSPGNDVYSWDPAGPTWDATANTGNWKTLVDAVGVSIDTVTEYGRDYAFDGKKVVEYDSDYFVPAKSIRFDAWEDDQGYDIGDRVSYKGGDLYYWTSFKCIQKHQSADGGTDEPGTGATWTDYWQKVKLGLPKNADDETNDNWYFVPVAPGTSVAEWHSDRMWVRADGYGDKSRILFSAPVHPDKGSDIPDVVFNMTDFAPGNDIRGPGGGWIPFNDGKQGGVVEALHSYGQYLIVFKRQAVWVVSGQSEETFTTRRLAKGVGAIGPQAVTEVGGLVYFLSDQGLYVTDGTAVEPVIGFAKLGRTIETRIDEMLTENADRRPNVWTWREMVWISLPKNASYVTYVYDPATSSWWQTNLPVLAAATNRTDKVPCLYFSSGTSKNANAYVWKYGTADTDDDAVTTPQGTTAIAWYLQTAWWPFGLARAQRRIRRVWAVVKGAATYTLKTYRDWSSTEASTVDRVVSGSTPVHIEGKWFADSHAVSLKLSGSLAPVDIYGIAVDTEPRRKRYHVA